MAKFCGNCGAQMEDGARVCGYCGTPFEGMSPRTPAAHYTDPEKRQKTKRTATRVVAALLAVVIVAVGVMTVTSLTGIKGTVRKVVRAYQKYDVDILADVCSDLYYRAAAYGEYDAVANLFDSAIGTDLEDIEAVVGQKYKLSYKIRDIYKPSERKLGMLQSYVAALPIDMVEVEDVRLVAITLTAKAGQQETTLDKTLLLNKESGKWKLLMVMGSADSLEW